MIVEPASIHSRSPLRRLLRAAGFAAPVALLAAIVAAALAGPKPAQDSGVDASASALAVVSPSAAPTASSSPAPSLAPLDASTFPAAYRSRVVVPPASAIAARRSPSGAPSMLIVAGYLAMSGSATRCAAPLITFGAWCDRDGLLYQSARAGGLDSAGQRPPHLHVIVPSGVVLPADVASSSGPGASGSVPVVVIGRFDAPGCAADPASCDHGFVVERLVWASGEDVPATALIEPGQGEGLSADPPETEDDELVPLMSVLARPATITRLDAAAGAVAERIRKFAGPFWYVRDVILARDGSLLPRWVLLDPGTGKTLATAPASPIGASPSG